MEVQLTTVRRVAATASDWLREDRKVVAALLVEIDGSAPPEPGALMLIAEDGAIEGSIASGCVGSAVVRVAEAIFAGAPAHTVTYGISDEPAGAVGPTRGGTVRIFVHALFDKEGQVEADARDAIAAGSSVAIATLLDGPAAGRKLALIDGDPIGGFGGPEGLDRSVLRDAEGMLAEGRSGVRRYAADSAVLGAEVGVHIHTFPPPRQMLIVGAVDLSVAIARTASDLGYDITISDTRALHLETPRCQRAGRTLLLGPEDAFAEVGLGPRDAALVLTHDPQYDLPALLGALASEAGYLGVLGSCKVTTDRARRLRESGLDELDFARIHAPCGLEIGSATPEEIAVSVLAEIIAVRLSRAGVPEASVNPTDFRSPMDRWYRL